MNSQRWRVRPAGSGGQGRAVSYARLTEAINDEEVGDLDEVLAPGATTWVAVGEHPQTAEYVPSHRRVRVSDPEEAESDMTPMIDVTFQLVIFFMIAATYTIQKTLDMPASKPDETGTAVTMEELEKNNIMVKVSADGTVTVDEEAVPVENLANGLRDAIKRNDTAELVMDVEDDALHDVVVKVIDAAGAAQIETVMFVSRVGAATGPALP